MRENVPKLSLLPRIHLRFRRIPSKCKNALSHFRRRIHSPRPSPSTGSILRWFESFWFGCFHSVLVAFVDPAFVRFGFLHFIDGDASPSTELHFIEAVSRRDMSAPLVKAVESVKLRWWLCRLSLGSHISSALRLCRRWWLSRLALHFGILAHSCLTAALLSHCFFSSALVALFNSTTASLNSTSFSSLRSFQPWIHSSTLHALGRRFSLFNTFQNLSLRYA